MNDLGMKPHGTSGVFITFCGLDGCGKTTMIRMFQEYLSGQGIIPLLTKQPTDTVRSSAIFRNFIDTDQHQQYEYRALSLLAASDRLQHIHEVVLPALRQGQLVISDRYFYSCLANLRARGYEDDRWIYEIASFIPKPDLSFFLDIPVENAVERVRMRKQEVGRYIDMELQYRLRDEYRQIAQDNGILIDSSGKTHDTFEIVKTHTDILFRGRSNI